MMTGRQFRENLEALGLTNESAAELLDVSSRQISRYAKGPPGGPPKPVAMLLRIMVKLNIKPEVAERLAWRPEVNSAPADPPAPRARG